MGPLLGRDGFVALDRHRRGGCGATGEKIGMLTLEDVSRLEERRKLINDWNAGHPTKAVSLIELPNRTNLVESEFAALAQTESCFYDVVNIDVAWTAEAAGSLDAFPVDKLKHRQDFLPSVMQTGRVENKQVTIPFATDAALLFYRADLMRGNKLPTTFREAVAMGDELKGELEGDDPVGYLGQFANYEGLTVNALEAIWSNGSRMLTPEGGPTLDDSAEDALNHLLNSVRISAIRRDMDEGSSIRDFREKKAVFLRNWPYAYHQLSTDPALDGKLGIIALPWHSVLGGHNLGVTKSSSRKTDAHELIGFLTNAASQELMFTCGGYPPVLKSTYSATTCPQEQKSTGEDTGPVRDLGAVAAQMTIALGNARPRPQQTWYSRYSRVLRRHLHRALSADGSALDYDELRSDLSAAISSS